MAVGVGVGVEVGTGVRVAEGVEVNEGKSVVPAAKTVKERVIFFPSGRRAVIICSPGSRPAGGVHFQLPKESILTEPEYDVGDSMVMFKVSPAGPVPKISGI